MSGLFASMERIRLIAGNTFLEALRQKFFSSVLLLSLALVGSAQFFQQFDFGTGELKFITDFGFGALFFFGSILAITATTQLFFNEIEQRTALTLLAKPVYVVEFLAGKFLGAWLLMAVFSVLLIGVLSGILYWRESELMARLGEAFSDGRLVDYGDLWIFGLLQWIKFGIIAAITLFIASFARSNLYTMLVSFFALVICQLEYIALDAYANMAPGLGRVLVNGIALIFPNFQMFNVGDQLVLSVESPLPLVNVLGIVGYGCIYIGAFVLLSQLNFRHREI